MQRSTGMGCFHRLHAADNEMRLCYYNNNNNKKNKSGLLPKGRSDNGCDGAEAPRETSSSRVRVAEGPPRSRCFCMHRQAHRIISCERHLQSLCTLPPHDPSALKPLRARASSDRQDVEEVCDVPQFAVQTS